MTITSSRERLWTALFDVCRPGEVPTATVVALLTEARHWCDRHAEQFAALDYVAHELYLSEVAGKARRRP